VPRLAPSLAREIAAVLADRTGGASDLAFLRQRDTIYFARGVDDVRSAATVLIQGIYATVPGEAHFFVRNTIHVTREPGPFALGMTKVAARRICRVEARAPGTPPSFEPGELGAMHEVRFEPPPRAAAGRDPAARSDEEWLRFAAAIVAPPRADVPLHARDRRVGAVLVSPAGRLLAASANTNGANRTLHAELNVLTARWLETRERLPRGTRLYVTLRPCKMCAGLVWELSEEPGTVAVFFAADDPGSAARNTVLCPGSAMRARFARTPAELAASGGTRIREPEAPLPRMSRDGCADGSGRR